MEKVIVKHGFLMLSEYDVKEVNELLSAGWKVKHFSTCATKDNVTVVFVLEI